VDRIRHPNIALAGLGEPVVTRQQWFEHRRPELKSLFLHYMYGWFPPAMKMHGTVTHSDTNFFAGKATLKLVSLKFGPEDAPEIHLLIIEPNRRQGPLPIFLGMNFNGNHTVITDTNVPLPTAWIQGEPPNVINHHATDAGRGTETHVWELEQSIDRGYAVATYYCGDVEPDTTNAQGGVRETVLVPHASFQALEVGSEPMRMFCAYGRPKCAMRCRRAAAAKGVDSLTTLTEIMCPTVKQNS